MKNARGLIAKPGMLLRWTQKLWFSSYYGGFKCNVDMNRILKESVFMFMIFLFSLVLAYFAYYGSKVQNLSEGSISTCLVVQTGPSFGYGPTDQGFTCESAEFGLISLSAPPGTHLKVGQSIEIISFANQSTGAVTHRVH